MKAPVQPLVISAARFSCAIAVAAFIGVPSDGAFGEIAVTNSGAAAGLNAFHAPDQECIPVGQPHQTGGAAAGDFNNDSWPDLFVLGGGLVADTLFINDGTGEFIDQAAAWGVSAFHGGNGAAVGDYNNDGWQDIYVTSFGEAGGPAQPGKHKLYRNNGNGTFTDVAVAAGVNQTTVGYSNGYGAGWGDYDLDGDLDLFVTAWKDTAGPGNGGTGNRLFRNNGNETFTDVTDAAIGAAALQGVWGFQAAFVDMNDDLFPELLISADFVTSRYLINNGDGTFTNATVPSGTGLDSNGMGQTVADFNHDQRLDWYVTSIYRNTPPPGLNGNALYVNQGNHTYVEASVPAGVNDGGWGWGAISPDLNNDGWPDIVEVNGRGSFGEWANEREYLFRNDGDGTFTEIGLASGLDLASQALCIVWLDADRDGLQDFAITVNALPMRYYRNTSARGNAWIRLTFDNLANPNLPPLGYGAKVVVTAGGLSHHQYFSGSPSYLGTSELALHFGLGSAKIIDQIEVHWPRGQVSVLTDVAPNQFLHIPAPETADINASGSVNVDDLLSVIASWGPCAPCAADVNADNQVNVDDLLDVINNWG